MSNVNDLRRLARQARDANQTWQLLALAAIYEGRSRGDAVRIGGVGMQIVRDWVVRFNADSPDGLINRHAPGQPPLLNDAQRHALWLWSRDVAPHDHRTASTYIFRAICPREGQDAGLVLAHCDTGPMGLHPARDRNRYPARCPCCAAPQAGGWHVSRHLVIPAQYPSGHCQPNFRN
jgi:hypothetical protein